MDVQKNDQSCKKKPAEVSVYKREPIRSKQAEQLVSNRVSCCEVQDKTKNINKEVEMSRKVQVCLGWTFVPFSNKPSSDMRVRLPLGSITFSNVLFV